jgi:hypothetical protein
MWKLILRDGGIVLRGAQLFSAQRGTFKMQNPDETVPSSDGPVYGADLPPIFANQFHVSVLGGVIRIVFGEVIVGGGAAMYPHAVMTMTVDRATELSALIVRVIQSAAEVAAKEQHPGSSSV